MPESRSHSAHSPSRDEVFRRFDVTAKHLPRYVVWELTLACDHRCLHCGSRAGDARPGELTTAEAIDVVEQLAKLGCFEVVLIGGEAYLHEGFLEVVRALKAHGIRASMSTGGLGVTPELAKQMFEAGMHTVSVSVDGLEAEHDAFRARPGSHAAALEALRVCKTAGLRTAANTNFNRLNVDAAEAIFELLAPLGILAWQPILTVPLGRGADRPAMLLQPWDLLKLMPTLARLKVRAYEKDILVHPSNNLGYFGPDEALLRSPQPGMADHFHGCQAGKMVMGIEAHGAVKGCPSLQSATYVGGSVKERSLEDLWNTAPQIGFARARTVEDLWGFCRTCPFAASCLGGCTYSAHALFDRPGNNPMCHYRARVLESRGLRERLVPSQPAPGAPFDNGKFEIREEPFDAPDPKPAKPSLLLRKR